jgi:hypothetical protein
MTMDEDDLSPNDVPDLPYARQGSSLLQQAVNPDDTPEGITDVEATSVAPIMSFVADQRDLVTLSYAVLIGTNAAMLMNAQ